MVKLERCGYDPLRYLVNNLNSSGYRNVARAYLTELSRDIRIRKMLYPAVQEPTATNDEKTALAQVFASSGGQDSIAPLEVLSDDPVAEVSPEAPRSLTKLP